jgi:hypothetical protein
MTFCAASGSYELDGRHVTKRYLHSTAARPPGPIPMRGPALAIKCGAPPRSADIRDRFRETVASSSPLAWP